MFHRLLWFVGGSVSLLGGFGAFCMVLGLSFILISRPVAGLVRCWCQLWENVLVVPREAGVMESIRGDNTQERRLFLTSSRWEGEGCRDSRCWAIPCFCSQLSSSVLVVEQGNLGCCPWSIRKAEGFFFQAGFCVSAAMPLLGLEEREAELLFRSRYEHEDYARCCCRWTTPALLADDPPPVCIVRCRPWLRQVAVWDSNSLLLPWWN